MQSSSSSASSASTAAAASSSSASSSPAVLPSASGVSPVLLPVLLHPPPRVVVVCHGMAAHCNWGFLPSLSESILQEVPYTHAVFRFDFTGCGASEGEFQYGGYASQVADIAAAVSLLRGRGFAVQALVGHSMGANAVLLYASDHHDVPNIVSISARYQMTRGLPFGPEQLAALQDKGWFVWRPKESAGLGGEREVRVTQQTMNERLSLDMDCVRRVAVRDEATGVFRVRVLTVHGNSDVVIPVEDAHRYAELIGNHTLRTLDDADHNYTTQQARLLMITTVCEWLSKSGPLSAVPGSPGRLQPAAAWSGINGLYYPV